LNPTYSFAIIKPLTAIKGVIPIHIKEVRHENKNPIVIPVNNDATASSIDANPSVDTPLIT
jgi:hypothetical protein